MQVSLVSISLVLVLSGILLDFIDLVFIIPDNIWNQLIIISKDLQILGYVIIATVLCSYTHLHTKVILFLLCFWRLSVVIINVCFFQKEFSLYTVAILNIFYVTWAIRLIILKKIKSREPREYEAYYVLMKINSFKGLFQAVFLPWYPARYETRMIVEGDYIWSIYHGRFIKKNINLTNIDEIEGIKVPIGRMLSISEIDYLNDLVGKKAYPGIRDCRNFLKVGKFKLR